MLSCWKLGLVYSSVMMSHYTEVAKNLLCRKKKEVVTKSHKYTFILISQTTCLLYIIIYACSIFLNF